MGLLPPSATVTADKMEFDGKDLLTISHAEQRHIVGKDIAMIFQEPVASLNPCFTIGFQIEEVAALPSGHGPAAAPRPRHRTAAIRSASPTPKKRLNAFPHQMSGGQCQRVMIAMAIACNPKLLIADEPTTALDVTIQKQILDLLVGLQAENGMALIMITHNIGVVAETADRVIVQYQAATRWKRPTCSPSSRRPNPPTRARCSPRCPKTPPAIACPPSATMCEPRGGTMTPVLETRHIVRDYHVGGVGLRPAAASSTPSRCLNSSVEKGKTLAIVGESRLAASRRWRASSR